MRFFLLFALSTSLFGTTTSSTKAEIGSWWEVGGSFQILVPNQLPDFMRTVTVYGPMVAIPLGENKVELQATYGSAEAISLFLAEVLYRYKVPTPFVSVFLLGGAGYLHHGSSGKDHSYVTPIAGLGFYFPMTDDFCIAMRMKAYYPEKSFLNFGGQFAYLF